MATVRALPGRLFESEVLLPPVVEQGTDRRGGIGSPQRDAADNAQRSFQRHGIGRRPAGVVEGADDLLLRANHAEVERVARNAVRRARHHGPAGNALLRLVVPPEHRQGEIGERGPQDQARDGGIGGAALAGAPMRGGRGAYALALYLCSISRLSCRISSATGNLDDLDVRSDHARRDQPAQPHRHGAADAQSRDAARPRADAAGRRILRPARVCRPDHLGGDLRFAAGRRLSLDARLLVGRADGGLEAGRRRRPCRGRPHHDAALARRPHFRPAISRWPAAGFGERDRRPTAMSASRVPSAATPFRVRSRRTK